MHISTDLMIFRIKPSQHATFLCGICNSSRTLYAQACLRHHWFHVATCECRTNQKFPLALSPPRSEQQEILCS